MIQVRPLLSLHGSFEAQDLPPELQLTLLTSIVKPLIVSSSMAPTIQAGDRLELSPPTSLTVGSIVVFRNDSLLVCHRIMGVDQQGTLSTRGDATQSPCEIVQPSSVIGIVTGLLRGNRYLSLEESLQMPPTATQPTGPKSPVRTLVIQSISRTMRILTRFSLLRQMATLLLQWTATVDVFTPAPLRSLPSLSKTASFTLRTFPWMAGLLGDSDKEKPARYVIRLGPWRMAQYDPTSASLLLRQSLRDAGLEPFFLQIFAAH